MSDSTLKPEILRKYKGDCRVFIETGTSKGEGVQVALDGGFQRIITIEANPNMFMAACERFSNEDKVLCAMGDGGQLLGQLLRDVHEPALFWLDSHWSTGEDPLAPGISSCPLVAELRHIAEHGIKEHVILIDDMRYFRGPGIAQWGNVTLSDIIDGIGTINRDYWITFDDGFCAQDVLVAKVNRGCQ
jgi:hypothetical protein